MKRCVYGVDINLLAVELAKLSLWLDSFTIGTPLTFLDHHIKEGDSLIGLWLDDIEKRTGNDTIDEWVDDLSSTGSSLTSEVAMPADLTAAQTEESRKNYDRFMQKTRPLRIVLDVATAEIIDERLGKAVPRNLPLIEKTATSQVKPPWWSSVEASVTLAKRFKSFQWELEFPDVYRKNSVSGFDLIITNPPWDAVKPKDTEYFSQYYPGFRKIQGKQERLKIKKQLLQDPGIAKGFEAYKLNIQQKLNFFKNPATYVRRGSGDTNLWKLFLERVLRLRGPNGNLAIVVPSGILNDEGAKELREELFKNRIRFVYEFENTEGIFNIHRSYKFVLLVADRAPPSSSFKAAFYLHKVAALKSQAEREKFIDVPFTLVLKSAPDSLTIPELRNKDQLEVFSKIYATQPLLSDKNKSWTVKLIAELHQTNDSKIFRRSTQGWPLIEGKDFWQFDPNYEKPTFTIDPKDGLARTKHHEEYRYINEAIHNNVRLAFRDIGSSTNTRSVVACLLPPHSFSPNTAIIVQPSIDSETIIDDRYTRLISYLEGVFNSFVFDFLIRSRIFMHLNFFYVYQTPVPKDYDGKLARRIQQCAACLNFVDDRFDQLGIVLEVPRAPAELSKRIELTAELNALVATHYGLSRSEVEVILKSFDGFEEDDSLSKRTGEVTWDPVLIRKFNGEVRKRVLHYFDLLGEHT
jgi:hypothetical protein